MKKILFAVLAVSIIITSCKANQEIKVVKKEKNKVLIFSKTNGWRHKSIPSGIAAIKKLGIENDFLVEATEDSL